MGEKVNISGKWYWLRRPRKFGADDVKYLERFEEEFKNGYVINSSCVARYICKCNDETGDYILEDFVDGEHLLDFLNKQRITLSKRKKITEQIATGMAALEECGIPCSSVSARDVIITSIDHDAVVVSCNGKNIASGGANKIARRIILAARTKCLKIKKKKLITRFQISTMTITHIKTVNMLTCG